MAIGLPAALVVLALFPPREYPLYPPCYFHRLTGLHCAGCGATRCLSALLQGDVAQAAAYNVLFLLALPFLIVWGAAAWYRLVQRDSRPIWQPPPRVMWTLFVVLLLYWILRNIDVPPFTLLAPHAIS